MADPLSSAPQVGHNGSPLGDLTPPQMRELLAVEEDLRERRKELTKDTRVHTRSLESLGVPLPAWKGFVKIREEAGTIRDRNLAALTMLLGWDLKPFGLQASMDLTAGQGSPELNVHELKRVDTEGFEAGKNGKKRAVNPYSPSTEAAQRFDAAWLRGQAEVASSLATNPTDAAAARRAGRGPQEELLAEAANGATRRRRRTREQIDADNAAAAERAANGTEEPKRRGRPPGSKNRATADEGNVIPIGGERAPEHETPESVH